MQNINKNAMENELLFFWLAKYMEDTKIKNKKDLTSLNELLQIDSVDDLILKYLKSRKYAIRYVAKSDEYNEYVGIFKWKKLLIALNIDKFLIK